jgi:hypothetical protein
MPKPKNRSKSSQKGADMPPDPKGDIAPRVKRTYETRSCSIPRMPQVFVFRQTEESTITASNSGAVTSQFQVALSSYDNVTPLTALFDQYRVDCVRYSIVPQQNAVGLFTNSTTSYTPLYCVIDYDDGTGLSSTANARAYDNLIELGAGESLCRVFAPRVQEGVNNASGTAGGIGIRGPQWIDCASTSVLHYGIKVLVPQVTAAQTLLPSWNVFVEIYTSFTGIR